MGEGGKVEEDEKIRYIYMYICIYVYIWSLSPVLGTEFLISKILVEFRSNVIKGI